MTSPLNRSFRLPNRREILAGGTALATLAVMPLHRTRAETAYKLKALPSRSRIAAEPAGETEIWSYNDQLPGPVIRAKQGQKLRIEFEKAQFPNCMR